MKKIVKIIFILLLIICSVMLLSSCVQNQHENDIFQTYEVLFETYGGSHIDSIKSDPKTGKISRPNDPKKDGYTFINWYDSESFETIYDFDQEVNETTILYALWEKNKYTILFDGNGSTSGKMDKVLIETGEVVKLPKNAYYKNGYSFLGWSNVANGVVKTPDNGYYMADLSTESVNVLYAIWEPNEYLINFDFQGGQSNIDSIVATFDSDMPKIYDGQPEYEGYIFCGYFSEPDGQGEQFYDENLNATNKYNVARDMILYAHWVPTNTLLEFMGNGAIEGNQNAIVCKIGDEIELPICEFVKVGYRFKGWSLSKDCFDKIYLAEEKFVVSHKNSPILYAIWEAITYQIDFYYNDEKISQTLTYDKEESLINSPFNREGYTLLGWSRDVDGNIEFVNGEMILNLTNTQNYVIVLYSIWSANAYKATLDKQKGYGGSDIANVIYGNKFDKIQVPKRDGYIFIGYSNTKNDSNDLYIDSVGEGVKVFNTANDIILFAIWIPKNNTLIFDGNGATDGIMSNISVFTEEKIMLPSNCYSKVGYEFVGWMYMSNKGEELYCENEEFTVPILEEQIIIFAKWIAKKVQIIFEPNCIEIEETIILDGESDIYISLPNGYERNGYSFIGWSTKNENHNNVYREGQDFYICASDVDIKLYAVWEIIEFSITYNIENGINYEDNPMSYTIEDSTIIIGNPSRIGYTFVSWQEGNTIIAGSTGNKVFTAVWETIKYKIHYALNGGQNSPDNPIEYTIEQEIVLVNPIKFGFNFLGWNEGNSIHKGSIGDKTFTAIWDGIQYKISYDLDGGINGAGNPVSYTSDSDRIVLSSPNRLGYKFLGWFDESLNAINNIIENGSQGDKKFIAKWEIEKYSISYILEGGTNSSSNPDSYTIIDNIFIENPTKPGYVFIGWVEGDLIEVGSTGDKTFTAKWKKDEYAIVYILGTGAINHSDNPSSYAVDSDDIIIKDPSRIGYVFSGWKEGSDVFIPHGSTGDKYLEAEWNIINYSIIYELNGENVQNNNPTTYTIEDEVVFTAPARLGYKFVNWSNSDGVEIIQIEIGTIGDITLFANWTQETYNITYDLGVGAGVVINNNQSIYTAEEEIILIPLELKGYDFLGWTDENGNNITRISKGTVGDIVLIANWKEVEYSITYIIDDEFGVVENINKTTITISEEIVLEKIQASGYKFIGWADENGNIIEKIEKGTSKDLILTAVFEKI